MRFSAKAHDEVLSIGLMIAVVVLVPDSWSGTKIVLSIVAISLLSGVVWGTLWPKDGHK